MLDVSCTYFFWNLTLFRYHPGNYPDEKKYFALPRLFLNVRISLRQSNKLMTHCIALLCFITCWRGGQGLDKNATIQRCIQMFCKYIRSKAVMTTRWFWETYTQICPATTLVRSVADYKPCEPKKKQIRIKSKCVGVNEILAYPYSLGDHCRPLRDGTGEAVFACCS